MLINRLHHTNAWVVYNWGTESTYAPEAEQ